MRRNRRFGQVAIEFDDIHVECAGKRSQALDSVETKPIEDDDPGFHPCRRRDEELVCMELPPYTLRFRLGGEECEQSRGVNDDHLRRDNPKPLLAPA